MLVNRCASRFGEYYALPGGGQHTGEMLAETVRRELLEETGYAVVPLLDPDGAAYQALYDGTRELGFSMGAGSLKGTAYEGDEAAAAWFAEAFIAQADGTLPEKRAALLADENCEKWRRADVRSVTKAWILDLLEQDTDDVREVWIGPDAAAD